VLGERKQPNTNFRDHLPSWHPLFPQSAAKAPQPELGAQPKAATAGCCAALEREHACLRTLQSSTGAGPSSSTVAVAEEMLGTAHAGPVGCSATAPRQRKQRLDLLEKRRSSCVTASWWEPSSSCPRCLSQLPAGFPGPAASNTARQPGQNGLAGSKVPVHLSSGTGASHYKPG